MLKTTKIELFTIIVITIITSFWTGTKIANMNKRRDINTAYSAGWSNGVTDASMNCTQGVEL